MELAIAHVCSWLASYVQQKPLIILTKATISLFISIILNDGTFFSMVMNSGKDYFLVLFTFVCHIIDFFPCLSLHTDGCFIGLDCLIFSFFSLVVGFMDKLICCSFTLHLPPHCYKSTGQSLQCFLVIWYIRQHAWLPPSQMHHLQFDWSCLYMICS